MAAGEMERPVAVNVQSGVVGEEKEGTECGARLLGRGMHEGHRSDRGPLFRRVPHSFGL
jgi:hypothetical protein